VLILSVLALLLATGLAVSHGWAQADSDSEDPEAKAARMLEEGEAELAREAELAENEEGSVLPTAQDGEQIDLLKLFLAGKWLMLPIALMSFLMVTFGIERALALRRNRVLPTSLISGLGALAAEKGGLDPRRAYRLCQQFPSAASSVIKAMLLKVGRPHNELEQAVADASEREATRLYSNVRWLTLTAGVTPLMGLLGTVWGMIEAFFVTAHLPTGANKAEHLASGIYMALVTTFAGLAVAIPAAILAHFFEGRIQKLMLELDETLLGLMPQLERFEGRIRVSREAGGETIKSRKTTDIAQQETTDDNGHKPTAEPEEAARHAPAPK
jgi:biopolymer transport protein ExbB